MLRNAVGEWGLAGGAKFPRNKLYEGVRFNVIKIMRGGCVDKID